MSRALPKNVFRSLRDSFITVGALRGLQRREAGIKRLPMPEEPIIASLRTHEDDREGLGLLLRQPEGRFGTSLFVKVASVAFQSTSLGRSQKSVRPFLPCLLTFALRAPRSEHSFHLTMSLSKGTTSRTLTRERLMSGVAGCWIMPPMSSCAPNVVMA